MIDRHEFDQSEELIASLKARLYDWGWHGFGDVDLGYPKRSVGCESRVPREAPSHIPTHGPDDAEVVELLISTAAQSSLASLRNGLVLRMEFVRRDLPKREKARRFGISRRTYQRRVDDALFWFYRISLTLENAVECS